MPTLPRVATLGRLWPLLKLEWPSVAAATLLLLLGSPFRHAQISSPDATILPKGLPSRAAFDALIDFGRPRTIPFGLPTISHARW